jgi:hypothetical protein
MDGIAFGNSRLEVRVVPAKHGNMPAVGRQAAGYCAADPASSPRHHGYATLTPHLPSLLHWRIAYFKPQVIFGKQIHLRADIFAHQRIDGSPLPKFALGLKYVGLQGERT